MTADGHADGDSGQNTSVDLWHGRPRAAAWGFVVAGWPLLLESSRIPLGRLKFDFLGAIYRRLSSLKAIASSLAVIAPWLSLLPCCHCSLVVIAPWLPLLPGCYCSLAVIHSARRPRFPVVHAAGFGQLL